MGTAKQTGSENENDRGSAPTITPPRSTIRELEAL
jgi:hypothetical protein